MTATDTICSFVFCHDNDKCIIFWLLPRDMTTNDVVGNYKEHLNPVNGARTP